MNALADIYRFRNALSYGYYPDDNKRAVYSLAFDEAMALWRELTQGAPRQYLYVLDPDPMSTRFSTIPVPVVALAPEPGRIWATFFGIRVFVEPVPESKGVVVILGANMPEAAFWKWERRDQFPDLADARVLSLESLARLEGLRVRKIYIAPGAERGKHYDHALAVLRRSARVMRNGDANPVYLPEHIDAEETK